jgi:preprotein translocase subunit SecD
MIVRSNRFNFYLVVCFAVALGLGCKTSEESKRKKLLSRIALHQETIPDTMGRTESAEVYRESPMSFTVYKEPFLSERNVKEAKVVDTLGGFGLRLDFDKEGGLLLEQYTAAGVGHHIAVFSQWDDTPGSKLNKGRWLAAPRIQTHISDGVFIFTPDATREEAENIARGLNNVAKRLQTGKEVKW